MSAVARLRTLILQMVQPGHDHVAHGDLWLLREGKRVLLSPAALAAMTDPAIVLHLPDHALVDIDMGDRVGSRALHWDDLFRLAFRLSAEDRINSRRPAAPLWPALGAAP